VDQLGHASIPSFPAKFELKDHKRWLVILLLFCLSAINYLDRQSLSVLSKTLGTRYGFGTIEYSYIVTSFLIAYTIGFGLAGRVLDAVGVRIGTAWAVAFWSAIAVAHALCRGWIAFAACRFLLGLGESFNTPAGTKAIAEWIPKRERGLSMAIFSNGNLWGAIVAPPFVSAVALRFGANWAFAATGLTGFIWVIVWLKFYRAPERHPALTERERNYILEERSTTTPAVDPRVSVWRDPLCQGLFLARFFTDPIPYFFTFWLPGYLQTDRGFSLAMVGALGWIPFLAADLGGPGGGAISDWLVRRGGPAAKVRLRLMLTAACVMPLAAVAVRTPSLVWSLALIALLLAAHSCWITNLLTLSSEQFPRTQLGTVTGYAGMGGSIGGGISTLLTGRVIAHSGYVPVFTCLAFLHLAAYLILRHSMRRRAAAQTRTIAATF
jgi:ACS family hexuronate transporter-like MFS transporter